MTHDRMSSFDKEDMIKELEGLIGQLKTGKIHDMHVKVEVNKYHPDSEPEKEKEYFTGSDTRPDNEEEKVALSPEQKLLKAIFDDDKSREIPCEDCKYGKIMDKTKTTIITLLEQCLAVPVCLVHDYNNAFKNCTEFDCDTEDVDQDS